MSDLENQMGLFELDGMGESLAPQAPPAPAPRPKPSRRSDPEPPVRETGTRKGAPAKKRGRLPKGAVKAVSGLVPEGDVRLTANIRQDLHLKLKIASAYRRITIGEIIEELIEKYV